MLEGSNGQPDPATIQTFVSSAAGPVDLKVGPGGDLYYVDLNVGTIRRIRANSGQAPTAVITGACHRRRTDCKSNFHGTASRSDPEHVPLTYAWDLTDDGTIDRPPPPRSLPTRPGTYTAKLQ